MPVNTIPTDIIRGGGFEFVLSNYLLLYNEKKGLAASLATKNLIGFSMLNALKRRDEVSNEGGDEEYIMCGYI